MSSLNQVQAALVWSDNFDDKNLNGWEIRTYYSSTLRGGGIIQESNSGFSVADGNLKSANLLAENYMSQTNFTHAQQNSNVAYGT